MNSPLADRLRPKTLDEVFGQRQLLAPGTVFRSNIEAGRVPNMIFYGPPGVGKTTVARIIAVCGFSQPLIGDHRIPDGRPSARCWGSKMAIGPILARARMVAVRLSGRVLVHTTAPGASRMAGMTRCRPLPERGGPMTMMESSTDAHTLAPFELPSR